MRFRHKIIMHIFSAAVLTSAGLFIACYLWFSQHYVASVPEDGRQVIIFAESALRGMVIPGFLLLIVLASCMAIILSRFISRPIEILRNTVRSAGNKGLDLSIDIKTADEIEQISDGFKAMSLQIEGFPSRFEQQLKERTESLHKEISELKKVEEDLHDSRDFFEEIIESSLDPILITDANGYVTQGSRSFEQLSGYSCEDIIGRHVAEYLTTPEGTYETTAGEIIVIDKEVTRRIAEIVTGLIDSGRMSNKEFYLLRKDGRVVAVEQSIVYMTNKCGDRIAAVGTIRDITEKKKAEREIKESRDFLENVFRTSSDGIFVSDPRGHIVRVNEAVIKMLGYSYAELKGKHMAELTPPGRKYREIAAELMDLMNVYGFVKDYEVAFLRKEGTICFVEININNIIDAAGDITGGVIGVRDISERKAMQHQLHQSQKMEAIGSLAGGIAHDFNNILAAIIGYTELTIYQFSKNIKARQNLIYVLESAERGKELVEQILAFSRQGERKKKLICLKDVFDGVMKMLRATTPSTVEMRYQFETEAVVFAESSQMQQLLMNLCSNAVHAMSDQEGVLDIVLSEIEISQKDASKYNELQPGAYLKLVVSDTGTGIDSSLIDRVFDPFFTTKAVGKGTGMGLSMVHGIVKSHGGAVTVQSNIDRGTTFNVFLPRAESLNEGKTVFIENPYSGIGRILFVDDEPMLVDVGQKILESFGYSVVTACSSMEGLEIFKKESAKIDLIITDQTMPDMSGYQMAKEAIKVRPDIPIVLCTGYSEVVSEDNAKDAGIREFIMKPINREKIATIVKRILA